MAEPSTIKQKTSYIKFTLTKKLIIWRQWTWPSYPLSTKASYMKIVDMAEPSTLKQKPSYIKILDMAEQFTLIKKLISWKKWTWPSCPLLTKSSLHEVSGRGQDVHCQQRRGGQVVRFPNKLFNEDNFICRSFNNLSFEGLTVYKTDVFRRA